MKPHGREKKIKGRNWKKDAHPPKGYINWWENMNNIIPRSTLKLKLKRLFNI